MQFQVYKCLVPGVNKTYTTKQAEDCVTPFNRGISGHGSEIYVFQQSKIQLLITPFSLMLELSLSVWIYGKQSGDVVSHRPDYCN